MLAGGPRVFLYRSNRSERLVDKLSELVRRPQADPFAPELIVVQSKGMERWLAMELSRRLAVFANARFPFPRHLLSQLFDMVLGEPPEHSAAFEQQALTWAIAGLLPELLDEPAFAPIAGYLEGDRDAARRVALAQRIARVLDDYTVYRPELLLSWERGEEQSWDARLWRELVQRLGRGHQAARAQRFIAALQASPARRAALPERLSLFGISSLPPLYVSVLSALAAQVETHLFVLAPSRAYFADIRGRRAAGAELQEEGHPLLASLGRLGRDFQRVLEERAEHVQGEEELFVDTGTGCLLHALQSDVLALRNRGAQGDPTPRLPIAQDDASLSIHVCHGAMRELEVLHDQLVEVLQDPRIEPHDIVVMTPDIEAYAPVIEAVFGQKLGRPALPFSVADRKTRTTHEAVDAFYALLDTLCGRLSASAVLDLLSLDCVRRRFEIASEELDQLRGWVERSGIRWGQDAEHRAELGQPALAGNTWRFGLERMLLGYAMEGDDKALYAGALPFDEIEGGAAELLGKLCELCARLFRHRGALQQARPLPAWRDALLALLDDFLDDAPGTAQQRQLVAGALQALVETATAGGFAEPLSLLTLQAQLEQALDQRLPARGLLSGGIGFCQLVPMRSIPFKVVCLIGMNDESFPGRNAVLGFDRSAAPGQRRAGDRSRRDDDRYMFLEALLAARERVIISYVGRGIHDNRVLPPSVVVGELLDAVAQGFDADGDAAAQGPLARRAGVEARLCTLQRLHAFSPQYFRPEPGSRLFSYAGLYCEAARGFGQQRPERRLIERPLPVQDELRALTIEELFEWISKPIQCLLRTQLGLYFEDDLEPLAEREPVELAGLDRWKLGSTLLEQALQGHALSDLLPAARGSGALPLGSVGLVAYQRLVPEIEELAEAAAPHRRGERLPPLAVDLELDGVRLTGELRELWPEAHLCLSNSRLGRRFELGHFIRHLVLGSCLQRAPRAGYPRSSVVVAPQVKDPKGAAKREVKVVRFEPRQDPEKELCTLIGLVREARRAPLPFVYEVSRAYVQSLARYHDAGRALTTGKGLFYKPEDAGRSDPYVLAAYPGFDRLIEPRDGPDFATVADRVFGPFFDARRER